MTVPPSSKKPPSALTPALRRELRARAHHLHPVVAIGLRGLTPRVLHEIDVALMAHGLVKLRVFDDDRAAREALFARICAELECAPVQHLGKLLILWRAPDEPPAPVNVRTTGPVAARSKRTAGTDAGPPAPPARRRRETGAAAPSGVPRAAMPRRRRAAGRAARSPTSRR
ncbi:MAG: YhbY family RNA-binding protein [Proteobacteria bacterium]|nr:YhbY family RNA-binding protein [Pseudomonadota bacterium]